MSILTLILTFLLLGVVIGLAIAVVTSYRKLTDFKIDFNGLEISQKDILDNLYYGRDEYLDDIVS